MISKKEFLHAQPRAVSQTSCKRCVSDWFPPATETTFPTSSLFPLPFADGCGLLQWRRNFSRNDFSVGKHHFLPSTSTFFIPTPALAVGDLYHLLLDGLTRFRVSRCSFGGHCYEATARSTSFMKPLVWTYRTRSGDSKPSSAFTDCNLTKSIASLCNL